MGAQWNSKVEQCGTVEQSWWNSVVEKWNSHNGTVWWNSKTVKVEQCEVCIFINSLAATELFKVRLLKDMRKIIDILSDPDCKVICPISIDYNDDDDDDDDDDNDDVDYRK